MRVAILSDIHAHRNGLDFALGQLKGRYDTIWFLGDAVGRGQYPVHVMQTLLQLYNEIPVVDRQAWIVGNHDLLVSNRISAVFFGKSNSTGNNREVVAIALEHRRMLEDADPAFLEWLNTRSTYTQLTQGVRERIVLVHGGFKLIEGKVDEAASYGEYVTTNAQVKEEITGYRQQFGSMPRIVLQGHTHIPALWRWSPETERAERLDWWTRKVFEFDQLQQRPVIVNPGSPGFPRDKERPECSCVILTLYEADLDRADIEFIHWGKP